MSRHPFVIVVRCEACPSVERIPFAPAERKAMARAIVAAQTVEDTLHGHRVEVSFELAEAAPVRDWNLPGVMTKIA